MSGCGLLDLSLCGVVYTKINSQAVGDATPTEPAPQLDLRPRREERMAQPIEDEVQQLTDRLATLQQLLAKEQSRNKQLQKQQVDMAENHQTNLGQDHNHGTPRTFRASSKENSRSVLEKDMEVNDKNAKKSLLILSSLGCNTPLKKVSTSERTFIAIKPDGVQRTLVGEIIKRFEQRGYKLVALKMVQPSEDHLRVHYQHLKDKPFFPHLIGYMSSGPIVAMVWEGLDVVNAGRAMLGATNPLASAPGSIRGDFSIQTGRNICHGSDSVESAEKEIGHWFKAEELCSWDRAMDTWIYE